MSQTVPKDSLRMIFPSEGRFGEDFESCFLWFPAVISFLTGRGILRTVPQVFNLTVFKVSSCQGFNTHLGFREKNRHLHPGRLTWNLQITHLERNMIFQTSMINMFQPLINLPGCNRNTPDFNLSI